MPQLRGNFEPLEAKILQSPADGSAPAPWWMRVIAGIVAIESLIFIGWAMTLVVEVITGRSEIVGVALGSAVMIALFAFALLVLARQWWAANPRVATPTLVWHVLAALIIAQLWGVAHLGIVLAVALVCVIAIAGSLRLILAARP